MQTLIHVFSFRFIIIFIFRNNVLLQALSEMNHHLPNSKKKLRHNFLKFCDVNQLSKTKQKQILFANKNKSSIHQRFPKLKITVRIFPATYTIFYGRFEPSIKHSPLRPRK